MSAIEVARGSSHRARLAAYLGAVALVMLTLGARVLLGPWVHGPTLIVFTVPIILSAYLGGLGPGLLATATAFVGSSYYLLPPLHSFAVASASERWHQSFLVGSGTLISGICEALRRARVRAMASEAQYRKLFDYAPDGILIANDASDYLDANASIQKMLGYTHDELVGLNAVDIVMPAEAEHIANALSTIASKADHQREWAFRRKDGSTFAAEVMATLLPDGRLLGMVRDITERKLGERLLRAQEALLHAADRQLAEIMQGMTEGCFALDEHWRFTFVNDRGAVLLRHPRGELVGHEIWPLFPALAGTFMESSYRRAMVERAPVSFEAFSPLSARWLDVRVFPTPQGLGVFLLDITDRKITDDRLRESEERFSQAFRSSPAAIAISRRENGVHLEANDSFLDLFECTREEVVGHTILELGILDEATITPIREELTARGRVDHEEVRARTRSGKAVRIDLSVRVTQLGGETCAVSTMVDMTARREAEEKLAQLHTELEKRIVDRTAALKHANEELEAFSYSVAHDLRAPLRAMNGFSQITLDDYGALLPAQGREHLTTIRDGALKMSQLIEDLLRFSNVSRQPLRKRRVDVASLVASVLAGLESEHVGRSVTFDVGRLPECDGDPSLLKQVWVNLLGNAVKYTRLREHAVIEIGCVAREGEEVYFVRDNGGGFDMQYVGKLFGVFQRLHGDDEYEGTGVGLAIVQRIVQRHGGRVWAEAALDAGATFQFTLAPASMS